MLCGTREDTRAGGQTTCDFARAWLSHSAIIDLDPAEAETESRRCRLNQTKFALLDVESLEAAVASKASVIAGIRRVSH